MIPWNAIIPFIPRNNTLPFQQLGIVRIYVFKREHALIKMFGTIKILFKEAL